MRGLYVN